MASCSGRGWRRRRSYRAGDVPDVVIVDWEVASDDRIGQIVATGHGRGHARRGPTPSTSRSTGCEPGRWYWYRFTRRRRGEPGRPDPHRARPPDASLERLRFAFASCQHYEHGYYAALPAHGRRGPRPASSSSATTSTRTACGPRPRAPHGGAEPCTLDDYRNRHALYKTDPTCRPRTRPSRGS